MALKINGTVVITNNRFLNNISSGDSTSETTLLNAVKLFDHKLIVQNSAGTTINTFYGANTA